MGVKPMSMNKGDSSKSAQASFSQFQDVPIPIGAEMDLDRTDILGARERWIGRQTLETNHNSVKEFNFFKKSTPEFGWQEITSIRSATSVITYSQTTRVLPIQIIEGKLIEGATIKNNDNEIGKVLFNDLYPFAIIKYLSDNFDPKIKYKSEKAVLKIIIPEWIK